MAYYDDAKRTIDRFGRRNRGRVRFSGGTGNPRWDDGPDVYDLQAELEKIYTPDLAMRLAKEHIKENYHGTFDRIRDHVKNLPKNKEYALKALLGGDFSGYYREYSNKVRDAIEKTAEFCVNQAIRTIWIQCNQLMSETERIYRRHKPR